MNAPVQLTPEWFDARKGVVTGSRVGAILGNSPFQNRAQVMRSMVREYLGAESEFVDNLHVRRGREHEKDAIEQLEQLALIEVEPAPLVKHPEHEWLAASPDGLSSDGGNVEVKCPSTIKKLSEVPHYVDQMELQMACTGRDFSYFVQWTPEDTQIIKVHQDKSWLTINLPALQEFMGEFMEIVASEELSAPYLAPETQDMSGCLAWAKVSADLTEYAKEKKKWEALEKKAKAELIELADGQKSSGCGFTVYETKRSTVDYKKLLADNALSVDGYEKESSSWSVRAK